jgi:hypothetical protein
MLAAASFSLVIYRTPLCSEFAEAASIDAKI